MSCFFCRVPMHCEEHNPVWYERAKKADPKGVDCAECGELNDHWDDVGWWYQYVNGVYSAVCSKCCTVAPGER